MAKGFEKHQERQDRLSSFGKELTRRSRSKCELCERSGQSLSIFEMPPVAQEPEIERCAFLCSECKAQLENPRSITNEYWRFLGHSIWSEVPVIQALSARILERIAREEQWATAILEEAYVDEDLLEQARAAPL